MTERQSESEKVDRGAVRSVLEDHPVRLAVLFGSTVRGDVHPRSDVDIAVEFDPGAVDSLDTRLSLWADLSTALDRDDVDISIVDDLDPAVGKQVFAEGELLTGSEERFSRHRRRFDRLAAREDRRSPAERFDEAIDSMKRVIDG